MPTLEKRMADFDVRQRELVSSHIRLETQYSVLDKRTSEMQDDLKAVLAAVNRQRGIWSAFVAIGAAVAAGVTAVIEFLFHHS